jgi:serine protease inhibitor
MEDVIAKDIQVYDSDSTKLTKIRMLWIEKDGFKLDYVSGMRKILFSDIHNIDLKYESRWAFGAIASWVFIGIIANLINRNLSILPFGIAIIVAIINCFENDKEILTIKFLSGKKSILTTKSDDKALHKLYIFILSQIRR